MKNQPLLTNIYELAETFYEKSSSCDQNVWISLEILNNKKNAEGVFTPHVEFRIVSR